MRTILVTGGTGYIGSHTIVELLAEGFRVVVYDNLSNSSQSSLDRIFQITGRKVEFIKGDLRDARALEQVFSSNEFESVMHFAGLKAVGESVEKPVLYYDNNVSGTLQLLKVMEKYGVKSIVFSSSATVYGEPKELPLHEGMPIGAATNPYGESKIIIERVLEDIYKSDNSWSIVSLRYFNPVGAHQSGLIGENPKGIPNNLMPLIIRSALDNRKILSVYGNDYQTKDGSGVRDYIHVSDLAKGHTAALSRYINSPGIRAINLGTGKGYTVFQIISMFESVNSVLVPHQIVDRRSGDIAECYASIKLAESELGWKAELGLKEMCRDSWHWATSNPRGYD